jgi:hypothetical protein
MTRLMRVLSVMNQSFWAFRCASMPASDGKASYKPQAATRISVDRGAKALPAHNF